MLAPFCLKRYRWQHSLTLFREKFSDTAKRLAQETSMCDTKEDEEEDDGL